MGGLRDEIARLRADHIEARKAAITPDKALEGALREYMGKPERKAKIIKAVDRLIDLAAESPDEKVAVNALKVLLDKVMSSAKQDEDGATREAPEVRIIIENATARVAPKIIDAEFTEEESP